MEKQKTKNQKGLKFTLVILVLLILAVVLTAVVSIQMRKEGKILTFQDCVNSSGSTLQESYPEVCVAKNGQRFTNPSQQAPCLRTHLTSSSTNCR